MRKKPNFSEMMLLMQLMHTGLTSNASQVGKRGLDATFIDDLEKLKNDAIRINDEQEKLKADLKLKTEELRQKMSAVAAQYSEAKKIVKIEFPKAQWIEFGVEDKR